MIRRIRNKLNVIYRAYVTKKFKNKTIIIHTLGKVGSSTLFSELKKLSPFKNVFHTHFLSRENVEKLNLGKLNSEENLNSANKVFEFEKKHPDNSKYIITLVREPVSRELSNFMQNPKYFLEKEMLEYSAVELEAIYKEKVNFNYTLNWFDTEFTNYTGFDVFSKKFDKEKGYSIYSVGEIKILVIKLEKLNACYPKAMLDFFGVNTTLSTHTNVTSEKETGDVYKKLKQSIKFDKTELEELYKHKYITHFYSKNEIDHFTKKHSNI